MELNGIGATSIIYTDTLQTIKQCCTSDPRPVYVRGIDEEGYINTTKIIDIKQIKHSHLFEVITYFQKRIYARWEQMFFNEAGELPLSRFIVGSLIATISPQNVKHFEKIISIKELEGNTRGIYTMRTESGVYVANDFIVGC